MADTKFLDYSGLQYFYEKLDEKFVDTTELEAPIKWDSETDKVYLDKTDKFTVAQSGDNAGKLDIDISKLAGSTLLSNGGLTVDLGTGLTTEVDSQNTGKNKVAVDLSGIAGDGLTVDNSQLAVDLTSIAGDGLTVEDGQINVDSYSLPTATASTLGGVKIGNGVTMVASDVSTPAVLDKLQADTDGTTVTLNASGKISVVDGAFAPLVSGKVPAANLPSYVDDVIEGYYVEEEEGGETVGKFYENRTGSGTELDPYVYTDEITGETGKVYVDLGSNNVYRYGGTTFVEITSGSFDIISNADIDTIMGIN